MTNSTAAHPPIAYHITFCTYASWQPDDGPGTEASGQSRGRWAPPRPGREVPFNQMLSDKPFVIEDNQRATIAQSIKDVCAIRGWDLLASKVRAKEVQVVVRHAVTPERMMTDMKARATRVLRQEGLIGPSRRVWARHGSTLYLFREADVERAVASCRGGGGQASPATQVATAGVAVSEIRARTGAPDLDRARRGDAGEVGLGRTHQVGVAAEVDRRQRESLGGPHRVVVRFG